MGELERRAPREGGGGTLGVTCCWAHHTHSIRQGACTRTTRTTLAPAPAAPAATPPKLPIPPPSSDLQDSTDLDVEARDPRDVGVYVYDGPAALHVGFQGPGWTLSRDPDTGYVFSLVDYCR